MNKMFLTSATGLALMTGVATSVGFSSGIYQLLSEQVDATAQKLAINHSGSINSDITSKEKSNLMVAFLFGDVANATSEEIAIKQHQATQMIISHYNHTTPHVIHADKHFGRTD